MKMELSMSRKGNCWDNAPTERFFRGLKHEQLNYEKFKAKEAVKLSIIVYLAFYNGKRLHSTLGYQSPLEFEREFYKKTA
jgi:putative transposase